MPKASPGRLKIIKNLLEIDSGAPWGAEGSLGVGTPSKNDPNLMKNVRKIIRTQPSDLKIRGHSALVFCFPAGGNPAAVQKKQKLPSRLLHFGEFLMIGRGQRCARRFAKTSAMHGHPGSHRHIKEKDLASRG